MLQAPHPEHHAARRTDPLSAFYGHRAPKVSEIWNSREQFEAFGERLLPILAAAGIQFAGPPEIFEAHNVVKG